MLTPREQLALAFDPSLTRPDRRGRPVPQPTAQERRQGASENPADENNYALGALRYMISRIDQRFMARLRRSAPSESSADDLARIAQEQKRRREEEERRQAEKLRETQRAMWGFDSEVWNDPGAWS